MPFISFFIYFCTRLKLKNISSLFVIHYNTDVLYSNNPLIFT